MLECHSEGPRLRLVGELTIYHAQELKDRLLDHVAHCPEPELHLGEVTELDTTGLQLLLLAKREASALDRPLRLTTHSQAVVEVLDLCQLSRYFGDPVTLSHH